MTPNIKKIKEFCDKNGIQFEVAPRSLTGLTTGYLIIDNSSSVSTNVFLKLSEYCEVTHPPLKIETTNE